tara:strand:- start:632 stop:1177 length:546 start_codon:yes stop_codon:yes gene_type:complete
MTVMHPADDLSAEELTVQLLDYSSPSYMRTARNKTPRIYNENTVKNLQIGKGSKIRDGGDVCIIACGVMVNEAISAAQKLSSEGIEALVVDMHTIKPLDTELIERCVSDCGCLVTAEDHSIIGGLGGAVAEYLSTNATAPLEMVGVVDKFGQSGSTMDLMRTMGMTADDIVSAAHRSISRK